MEFIIKLAMAMRVLGYEMSTIDWGKYSQHYKGKDYGTLILEYRPPGKSGSIPLSFGDIRDKWDSLAVVDAKFGILIDNPTFRASLQGRDPSQKLYGGAIRLDNGGLLGATRLPEIGDHALVSAVGVRTGMVSREAWPLLVGTKHPQVSEVLHAKEITYDAYSDLITDIVARVNRAFPEAV